MIDRFWRLIYIRAHSTLTKCNLLKSAGKAAPVIDFCLAEIVTLAVNPSLEEGSTSLSPGVRFLMASFAIWPQTHEPAEMAHRPSTAPIDAIDGSFYFDD